MQSPARPNLSGDLATRLRLLIVEGELDADQRLNEVHLAAAMGVSRTPLREALVLLAAEGFVVQVPRRGFFVRPLSAAEFQNLYRIRALLDPAALEDAGLPGAAQVARLERLNGRMGAARDPVRVIELDDQWHLTLLEHCPNPILIDLIRQHMTRTRRYELAYLREAKHVGVALEEHELILAACRAGDLPGACAALRQNMVSLNTPLLDWLADRESTTTSATPRTA